MNIDKKKIAAIGVAVSAYLREEEAEQAAVRPRAVKAVERSRLWSLAGRHDIMRDRQMWQLRIVPK